MNNEKRQTAIQKDRAVIGEKLDNLVKAMQETSVYHQYQKALDALKNDKVLYQNYKEFKQKNILSALGDSEQQETEQLYADYNELIMDRVVAEFLTAQQQMCNMINDIYEAVAMAADMDLSYFE